MRIAIVSMDTRGGIEPYVALGRGLKAAGHQVRAIAPSDFVPMFRDAGLDIAPLSGSVEEAIKSSGGVAEAGSAASTRLAVRELEKRLEGWTKETLAGCEGMDLLTGGIGGMVLGLAVAEKLGKPFVQTQLQPVGIPTDAYPGVLFANVPRFLGSFGLHMSHRLSELGIWLPFRGAMRKARAQVLGLQGPAKPASETVLYGFSRHVVPVPPAPHRHVTGYWTLNTPREWTPPPDLAAFLARPGPVVSVGFGSMASQSPEAAARLVADAVRAARVRAVLLSGWGGVGRIADDELFVAESIPHDWLFPKVRAVVHHGGAGTTGAALRAGVAAIVVPFAMDQPFWGSRVHALGVGPTPIPRKRLDAENLADALRRTLDDAEMQARATALGVQIRAEDGVANAVRVFDTLA